MLYLNNDETAVLELEDLSIEIEFPVLIINPLLNGLIKFLQGSQSFSVKMVSSDLITYYLYFDIYDITIIKSKNNHIEQFKYATSIDMIKEIYNSVSNNFDLWLLSFSSSQKEVNYSTPKGGSLRKL